MIQVTQDQTILDIVRMMLEAQETELSFVQKGRGKCLLDGGHLFDLFFSGQPAEQRLDDLLNISPALQKSKTGLHNQILKNTIRYFVSVFDSLHDGVLVADSNEVVRYINRSFERIAGAKFDNLVGQPLTLARPGAKLGSVIKNRKALLGVRRRFGDIEYMTDMHPICVNGICVGGITIARDITEIQSLQTKLTEYQTRYKNLLDRLKDENTAVYSLSDIVGEHPALRRAKDVAAKISATKLSVLIRGESGTGKELFAHAIHKESQRQSRPFVIVNCAAIPDSLLESELFGYNEGAFSGAKSGGRKGLIASANGGTVFLDEIGDMNVDLQAKMLRFLQTGEIQPLGREAPTQVDVRVIAATNANLEKKILEGKFREDLFYRLNASQIVVPSLRERKDDILILAEKFLEKSFSDHPLTPLTLSNKTKEILREFPWPGNVRELENTINFIGNITDSQVISSKCLPPIFYQTSSTIVSPWKDKSQEVPEYLGLRQTNESNERVAIVEALNRTGRSVEGKRLAAKQLGISLTTLYTKLKILNIR